MDFWSLQWGQPCSSRRDCACSSRPSPATSSRPSWALLRPVLPFWMELLLNLALVRPHYFTEFSLPNTTQMWSFFFCINVKVTRQETHTFHCYKRKRRPLWSFFFLQRLRKGKSSRDFCNMYVMQHRVMKCNWLKCDGRKIRYFCEKWAEG